MTEDAMPEPETTMTPGVPRDTKWQQRWEAYQKYLEKYPADKNNWRIFYGGCEAEELIASEYAAAKSGSAGTADAERWDYAVRHVDQEMWDRYAESNDAGEIVATLRSVVGSAPSEEWVSVEELCTKLAWFKPGSNRNASYNAGYQKAIDDLKSLLPPAPEKAR